ncbi:MAG: 50S ribosomal protein L3 [bacterium]
MLGKKVGMTRMFSAKGHHHPVTVVELGPCQVTGLRLPERDKYSAVQLGFGRRRPKLVSKPMTEHYKKLDVDFPRWVREIRDMDPSQVTVGQILRCDMFKQGDRVRVTATSKGRGFQGVIKRHGFAGPNASHGTHEFFRHGGAIGAHTDPGRVWKNMKMPGRMGGDRVTVRNLQILRVDPAANLVMVKGSIPGPNGGFVVVRKG